MDTIYRQPQPTLEDLLAWSGGNTASVPAYAAPTATAAPADSGDNQYRQRLLDILSAPEKFGPAPTVEKATKLQKILMGIGDSLGAAFQTYGSVLAGGGPQPGPRSFDRYLARLDKQKADLQAWNQKNSASEEARKTRIASLLLSESDRAQMKADEQKGRLELQTNQLAQRKADEAQAKEQFRQQKEFQAAQQAQEIQAKRDLETIRYKHDEAVAGIRLKASEGDKASATDQKKLGEIMGHIGGLAEVASTALAGGTPDGKVPAMTAEQMATKVRRLIDAQQLGPEAKKAAEAYFMSEVGPIIREAQIKQQNEAMAAGSPQPAASIQPEWANPNNWLRK